MVFQEQVDHISSLVAEIKHLQGQHDQSTHGRRYHVVNGQRVLKPKKNQPPPTAEEQVAAFQTQMQKQYPHISFDFSKAHPQTIQDVMKQFEKLAQEYPDIAERFTYIGTRVNENAAMKGDPGFHGNKEKAYAYMDGDLVDGKLELKMNLNPKVIDHPPDVISASFQKTEASGWTPEGFKDIGALITHEFGHAVNYHMLFEGKDKSIFSEIGPNNEGRITTIVETFQKNFYNDGLEVSGYARSNINVEINKREQFADAFMSMHYTPAEKQVDFTKQLSSFLKVMYPSGKQAWSNTPAQKVSAAQFGKTRQQWIQFYVKHLQKGVSDE